MNWFLKRIELVRTPSMSEAEINTALRVADNNPLWCAIVQMLDEWKEEAVSNASAESIENNALAMSGYLGGAEHLQSFKLELIRRRSQQIQSKRSVPSREPVIREPVED